MSAPHKSWRETLYQDWHRYYAEERTAKATFFALLFNGGFLAVFLFRLGQALEARRRFLLAKIARRLNLFINSAEINPRAEVGPGLHLPHPYGSSIGRGCRLGRDVTVHQGVSLGAKTVEAEDGMRRTEYPVVEDGVFLYPNVLAYGPITIGKGAIILGNSVVSKDVPPGATYGGVPAREITTARGISSETLRRRVQPRRPSDAGSSGDSEA